MGVLSTTTIRAPDQVVHPAAPEAQEALVAPHPATTTQGGMIPSSARFVVSLAIVLKIAGTNLMMMHWKKKFPLLPNMG